MPAPRTADGTCGVAVFDLDGTLSWCDTLMPYLLGYAARHPRWSCLGQALAAVVDYGVSGRDRGRLKSRLIRAVMGGDSRQQIDAWSDSYVAGLERRGSFRPAALAMLEAHRAARDHLVLLSASPDLYVPRIGRLLGFERTLCTELEWRSGAPDADRLDGALRSPNRRGEEKSKCLTWLRTQYPGMPVTAYGNSESDLCHLTQADRGLLVGGTARARRKAAESGIAVADWS
jgi:phosphatidylglycerophosphatase C